MLHHLRKPLCSICTTLVSLACEDDVTHETVKVPIAPN